VFALEDVLHSGGLSSDRPALLVAAGAGLIAGAALVEVHVRKDGT
jgi:3-oxoacyl-[acyl-carrier-protein] synthase III